MASIFSYATTSYHTICEIQLAIRLNNLIYRKELSPEILERFRVSEDMISADKVIIVSPDG